MEVAEKTSWKLSNICFGKQEGKELKLFYGEIGFPF
jgi:hypothetical protein